MRLSTLDWREFLSWWLLFKFLSRSLILLEMLVFSLCAYFKSSSRFVKVLFYFLYVESNELIYELACKISPIYLCFLVLSLVSGNTLFRILSMAYWRFGSAYDEDDCLRFSLFSRSCIFKPPSSLSSAEFLPGERDAWAWIPKGGPLPELFWLKTSISWFILDSLLFKFEVLSFWTTSLFWLRDLWAYLDDCFMPPFEDPRLESRIFCSFLLWLSTVRRHLFIRFSIVFKF